MSCAFLSLSAFAQVATPVFVPNDADGAVAFDVDVTCATAGASIFYTTNGVDPTQSSAPLPVNGKVRVARHLTLKARAYLSGTASAVASSNFRVTGAIFTGANHAMMLKSDGTAWSWGYQESGRLGNDVISTADEPNPQAVKKAGPAIFNDVSSAAIGNAAGFIVDASGRLWAFGNNSTGQIGDNATADTDLGKRVLKAAVTHSSAAESDFLGNTTDGVRAVSGGYRHALAVEGTTGKVWGWGERSHGRIADGYNSTTSSIRRYAVPVTKPDTTQLTGATQVAAGKAFSLALCPSPSDPHGRGQVWAWGQNSSGQLGINAVNSYQYRAQEAKLLSNALLNDVIEIAAGWDHAVVIRRDASGVQTAWCWGERLGGRLGDGAATTTANVPYAVQVKKADGNFLTDVIQVSAGPRHTLALTSDGKIWAWGNNGDYQRGDGRSDANISTADTVKVNGVALTGIVAIAAGGYETYDPTTGAISALNSYSLALHENGTIYGWGYNGHGQVANGQVSGTVTSPTASTYAVKASNQSPTISSVSAAATGVIPLNVVRPATISLSGTYGDPEGSASLSQVQYYKDGQAFGAPASASPWASSGTVLTAGTYQFSATVTDNMGAVTSANVPSAISIVNPTVTLSAITPSVAENSATPGKFRFTLNKAQLSDLPLTYSIHAASSATSGTDYQALSGTLTIPAGSTFAEVSVVPVADLLDEGTETVKLTFLAGSGHTASIASDTVSITNFSAKIAKPASNSGDNQTGPAGAFLTNPLVVEVRNFDTNALVPNFDGVTFQVISGGGMLQPLSGGTEATSQVIVADASGLAKVRFRQPAQGNVESTIQATIPGRAPLVFKATTNALVGRWNLDDSTSAADSSGTGYHSDWWLGTLSTDRVEGAGSLQLPAADFTGRGFRVQNTANRLLPDTASKPFTITMWLKTPQIAPGTTIALASNETYLASGFRLAVDTGQGFSTLYWPGDQNQMRICFWTGQSGGTVSLIPRRSISANEWHHVAVSYTGTGAALYVDGELVAEDEGTIVPNANAIHFGQGIGGVRGFGGNLDNVQIFAKALSATEVREMIPDTGTLVDVNSNNIPDLWETKVGLTTGALPDEDEDGVSNEQEYLNQTNPIEAFDLAARYPLDEPANVWDWPNTNASVLEKSGLGWNGVWKAAGSNAAAALEGDAAYEFSGSTNQGFTIPNTLHKVLPGQGTEPFSFGLWIKPGALAVGAKAAIATNQVDGQSGFRLMTEGVSGTPGLRVLFSTTGLGGTLELQSDPITANQWHHVTVTYFHNGTTGVAQMYVDGGTTNQGAVEGAIVLNAEDIKWAWQIPGVAGSYAGLMDDLRFYRKCLTQLAVETVMGYDWDRDGMANDWEVANNLDPLNRADASGDLDGDGLTNLAEAQLGMSAIMVAFNLAVEKIIPEAPATLRLTVTENDPDLIIGGVKFYENNTLLGTKTSAPWVWEVEGRNAANYTYKAEAFTGFNETFAGSATQSITVNNLSLTKKSGDALAGPVLSENLLPLVVEVRDGPGGAPLEGREVVFEVTNGNGRLLTNSGGELETEIAVLTDSAGQAKVWFRQPNVLNFVSQIKATSAQAEVTFTAKTVSSVLAKVSGDNQFGPVNGILAEPLVVEVRDSVTNAVIPNHPVVFSTTGQAAVSLSNVYSDRASSVIALTGADGKAKARFWSPSLPKLQSYIEATAAGNSVTFTATTHLLGNWVTFQVPLGRSSHAFELWEVTDEGATLKTATGPSMIYNGHVTSSGSWQPYTAPYASVQVERKDNGNFLLKDTTSNQYSPWNQYGLANAQWRESDGPTTMRYFAIPEQMLGDSLVVQYPSGETLTVTKGLVQGAYDQNNFVSFEYFEAWAPRLNPDTGWKIVNCTTGMEAPVGLEAPLVVADWTPFIGTLPVCTASFLVNYNYDLQNVSEQFTLHIEGGAATTDFSSVDANYHMSFTGSVPQGLKFWLVRNSDGRITPEFIMPGGGVTLDVAQYFAPVQHNWSYQYFTIYGPSSTSSFSIVHNDGTVTYLENGQTNTVYSWDEYGTQYSYEVLTAYANVDIAQTWFLQDGSSNLGTGNVFYINWSSGPNSNAPNGTTSYNIPGSRGSNPLRFLSGGDQWATSSWGTGTMGGYFGPNDEWVEWPFTYVAGNYSNWGVTGIRDLLTGETIDPYVTNPEGWFTSQSQSLKISSSRFGHDLRIRVGNGQEFTIAQHSIQGVWTMDQNGQSSFTSHNYFDATGTRYPDVPWWLLDYSRIGTNGKPELLAATGTEFDFSGAEDTFDSDGDGWSDWFERQLGTNPNSADTDGDGIADSSDPDPFVNAGAGPASSTLKIFTPLE